MIENTLFFHGWGYDVKFWQSYSQHYKHTNIFTYDRGYFSSPHKPSLDTHKTRCVTHSAGLFFAAQEYELANFAEVIIFAGFEKFPNQTAAKAMRLGLKKDPHKIMHDFYNACGFTPYNNISTYFNIEKLSNDLKMLETDILTNYLKMISYTAYHGQHDKIVPNPLKGAKILMNTGHLCNLI